MRDSPPGCRLGNGIQCLSRTKRRRRSAAHKLFFPNNNHIFHRPGGGKIDGFERRAVRRGTQDFPIEHIGSHNVGRIPVRPGHDIPDIRPGSGGAECLPTAHRRNIDIGGNRLLERPGDIFCFSQIRIADRLSLRFMRDHPIVHTQGTRIHLPPLGGKARQQLAGRRSPSAHGGNRARGRPAASRSTIVWNEVRIRHDQTNPVDRDTQLLCRGLGELCPRPLAFLDFTGHHTDRTILVDVKACRNGDRASATRSLTKRYPLGHRD